MGITCCLKDFLGLDVYPEYVGLAILNIIAVLYLLNQNVFGKNSKGAKAKADDAEPTRRSRR